MTADLQKKTWQTRIRMNSKLQGAAATAMKKLQIRCIVAHVLPATVSLFEAAKVCCFLEARQKSTGRITPPHFLCMRHYETIYIRRPRQTQGGARQGIRHLTLVGRRRRLLLLLVLLVLVLLLLRQQLTAGAGQQEGHV